MLANTTAQKAIAYLVNEKLLEIRPGIGSTIAAPTGKVDLDRKDSMLNEEMERLIVKAKQLNITSDELIEAIKTQWNLLSED